MNARNPYLQSMADEIGRRSNSALQQGFQGIRSNSVMGGGLGGSRQGVAEGAAISGAADSLQGNLANMYNTDYQAEEGRGVQRYGIDSQAASARYSADKAFESSKYSSDNSLTGSRYGADQSLIGSKYSSDNSLIGSKYGADTSLNIAGINDTTNRRGQDQTFEINTARNGIDTKNADTNLLRATNDFQLGTDRNTNEATGLKNNYDINLRKDVVDTTNANTNRTGVDNNFKLGSDRLIQDGVIHKDNLGLGKDKLALDTTDVGNRYDIALRDSDYKLDRLDADIYQDTFNNQVKAIGVGNDVQDRIDRGNVRGVDAATDMQNTPINYYQKFTGIANDVGQGGGTDSRSTSSQGNPYVSAVGGAKLGYEATRNLGIRDSAPATYDGRDYGGTRRGP